MAAYFKAFNSGSDELMKQYFAQYAVAAPDSPSIETRMERYHQARAQMGALTIVGVRVHLGDPGIGVTATTEQNDRVSLDFRVEENLPNRLLGIQIRVGN